MLVQRRQERLRLIRQEDHAAVSGALAHHWRDREGGALPFRVVRAAALHDAAWRSLDREPRLDPERGEPYDFQRHPRAEKLSAYQEGVERLSGLDAYAALQVSRHYASFLAADAEQGEAAAYLRREERRRARLRERLPEELREQPLLDRELTWLKAFDTLSLFLCLTAPGAVGRGPDWLLPERELETPDGESLAVEWVGRRRVGVDRFPLDRLLKVRVPYRDLPRERYGSDEALARAWRRAETEHLRLQVVPGEGAAGPGTEGGEADSGSAP